jgi:flagellar motor switch protein FliN/FliY
VSEGLSQEEIDALLSGGLPPAEAPEGGPEGAAPAAAAADAAPPAVGAREDPAAPTAPGGPAPTGAPSAQAPAGDVVLAPHECDALGEIGNITMASAATALSALVRQPVAITTPRVSITTEAEVRAGLTLPAAAVSVPYTAGLHGRSMFVLARRDCGTIVDLMMGGEGGVTSDELDEMQISGVGEAMNQMMGSAATALASLIGRPVNIGTPEVHLVEADADLGLGGSQDGPVVCVSFDLTIGSLLQTEIMQVLPVDFARELVAGLMGAAGGEGASGSGPAGAPAPGAQPAAPAGGEHATPAEAQAAATLAPDAPDGPPPSNRHLHALPPPPPPTVQPAAFPSLEDGPRAPAPGDIELLLDVPLQVTVELGRTQLRIRNVLELVPGSIIELEKLAGEPVDVLVNGRQIARGEVVVIDEEFGVRITDIASRAARLRDVAEA